MGRAAPSPGRRLHARPRRSRLGRLFIRPVDGCHNRRMERLHRVVGPIATNVHILADERSHEAIAIDTATPSLAWIADELAARGWTPQAHRLHARALGPFGGNAVVAEHTGAGDRGPRPRSRRLIDPQPIWAPFRSCRRPRSTWPRGRHPLRRSPAARSCTRRATRKARSACSADGVSSTAATPCSPGGWGGGPTRAATRPRDGGVAAG